MVILSCEALTKSFGERILFENAGFHVNDDDKIGLVGANGTGKSTLFKTLSGELTSDSGQVHFSKSNQIGYMEQHVSHNEDHTVYEEVEDVFRPLMEMEKSIEALHLAIEQGQQELVSEQVALIEKFEHAGGLTYKSRARSSLLKLGFSEEEMNRPLHSFSGGERSKISLCRLLLSNASLLLLDEPTNHLDINAILWLEEFLQSYGGAYIIISHDRYFLDRVTARTFEMEHQKLTVYSGNYTSYMAQKEERKRVTENQYKNDMREIKRIEGIIEQQRRWNREKNIKTAESKQKVVDKLKDGLVLPEQELDTLHFRFNVPPCPSNDILIGENLSKSFDGRRLFHVEKLHITKGERVFLLGSNGSGKTTLFKILCSQLTPDSGTVTFGPSVLSGYYDQKLAGLHLHKTALQEVWDSFPNMTQTQLRTALAIFLFKSDDVFKPISALSGGERARIALLILMLSKANILLLDEPTNHLDIASREALELALNSYDGTLFIISHDRYFINKMADRILYLDEDSLQEYAGNYDFFTAHYKESTPEKASDTPKQPLKMNEYNLKKEAKKAQAQKNTQIRKTEADIEAAEAQIKDLEEKLSQPEAASDYTLLTDITKQLEDAHKLLEMLYEEWETLSV